MEINQLLIALFSLNMKAGFSNKVVDTSPGTRDGLCFMMIIYSISRTPR
jgi:hypothetical protein